jgi:hypothetical protein
MATLDIEMLKRVSAELSTREFSRHGSLNTFEASNKNGRQIQQLLKSYAERAGFPVDELNRLRAKRQAERRRLFASRAADAAQVTNEEEVGFRQAMESQRQASRLLSALMLITLDQPNDIFLFPIPVNPVDFAKHIESFNSSAKISLNRQSGSDSVSVFFFFLWEKSILCGYQCWHIAKIHWYLSGHHGYRDLFWTQKLPRGFSPSRRCQGEWMGNRRGRQRPHRDVRACLGKYISTGGASRRRRRRIIWRFGQHNTALCRKTRRSWSRFRRNPSPRLGGIQRCIAVAVLHPEWRRL